MDLMSLITETVDKSIDLLSLVKLMKLELIRIANENTALKAEIVQKDQIIERLGNESDE